MAGPVSALLARATSQELLRPGDARAGAAFERVVVDGERLFVKRLSPASDWMMRVTGDAVHRPYLVWRQGVMGAAPPSIDHTVVAMEVDGTGHDAVLTVVMHDVAEHLVPEGDETVPDAQHRRFVEHLAALSTTFWGWRDTIGVTTMAQRIRFFAPDNIAPELAAADVPGPLAAADAGWAALAERSPALHRVATAVHADPTIVTEPLARTPAAFLHGDWKMGNLGSRPDGRTILLDWAFPGAGPPCWDLCWYVALNRARLPESKEATFDRFRRALEADGAATASWWDRQLALCTVAIMATFGWEKALGDDEELGWWERRVADAVRTHDLSVGAG